MTKVKEVKVNNGVEVGSELVLSADTPITDVIKALDAKIKTFDNISDSKYKTSGNLGNFGDIKKEEKLENLIKAHSYVTKKAAAYDESQVALNIKKVKPFEENNFSAEDWVADITLRVAIIEHKETIENLNKAKSLMAEFMTVSDKKALAFEQLKTLLG